MTPKEIEDEFRKKYERLRIQYVAFPAAKFRDSVKLSDDELRKFYESSKASYAQPEKLSYQVVVLDQDKVAATINVTDEQLRAAYSNALDNFRMPERVHARLEPKEVDAEKKTLKAKADDLLEAAQGRRGFRDLARRTPGRNGRKRRRSGLVRAQSDGAGIRQAWPSLKPRAERSGHLAVRLSHHSTLEKARQAQALRGSEG